LNHRILTRGKKGKKSTKRNLSQHKKKKRKEGKGQGDGHQWTWEKTIFHILIGETPKFGEKKKEGEKSQKDDQKGRGGCLFTKLRRGKHPTFFQPTPVFLKEGKKDPSTTNKCAGEKEKKKSKETAVLQRKKKKKVFRLPR